MEEIYECMVKNSLAPMGLITRAVCFEEDGKKKIGFDNYSIDFSKKSENLKKIEELSNQEWFIVWLDDPTYNVKLEKFKLENDIDDVVGDLLDV